jgi:hypothetical protein
MAEIAAYLGLTAAIYHQESISRRAPAHSQHWMALMRSHLSASGYNTYVLSHTADEQL